MPTALLIEAGTHTNSKEEAEQGIAMFTDVVPAVLGISPSGPAPQVPAPAKTTGGAWKALAWILGLTVFGGVGFILINTGSWKNAMKRLLGFSREFTGFFVLRPASRKPGKVNFDSGDDNELKEHGAITSNKDTKDR